LLAFFDDVFPETNFLLQGTESKESSSFDYPTKNVPCDVGDMFFGAVHA
jgi:hypothetical protein